MLAADHVSEIPLNLMEPQDTLPSHPISIISILY